MLYLKACPRCRGDVQFVNDIDGPFLGCLQCGFRVTSGHREIIAGLASKKPARAARVRERSAHSPLHDRDKVEAAS